MHRAAGAKLQQETSSVQTSHLVSAVEAGPVEEQTQRQFAQGAAAW